MKKKALIIICIATAVVAFIVIWLFMTENAKNTGKADVVRYDFEVYNIEYIQEHLESFEKLCEYDLEHYEHYDEYERIGDTSIEIKHDVPANVNPYYDERSMLFNKLGVYDGFDEGIIYPDKEMIVFNSNYDNYCMTLVYYKNGNNDISLEPRKTRIGNHFIVYCYELRRTNS